MLCKFILTLLALATLSLGQQCGREISCLSEKAQMTFLGKVMSVEETNSTYFSAEIKPLCTMYSTLPNTQISDEEYQRTVFVDGFGTHAGGSCNANAGVVGDTNIFFVWVNASRIHGVARRFGLYDPCYGAFQYDQTNTQALMNFISSHKSATATPNGVSCPSVNVTGTTGANGEDNKTFNFDVEEDSAASFNYLSTTLSLLCVFVSFIIMTSL